MATAIKGFKRGDHVCLVEQYSGPSFLQRGEVGMVTQKIRDSLLWRTKRINRSLFMVKGPKGDSQILRGEDIRHCSGKNTSSEPKSIREANSTDMGVSLPALAHPGTCDTAANKDGREGFFKTIEEGETSFKP